MSSTSPEMIDRAALARNTFGDPALQAEVLRLFLDQSAALIAGLKKAGTGDEWKAAAHKLKGSALGVGAGVVAKLAAQAEHLVFEADEEWKRQAILPLGEAITATNGEIAVLLA